MNEVSIILCTYNEEKFIENTIKQIVKSIKNSEIIIVDDDSKDETVIIIKRLKKKIKNIM